MAGTSPTDKIEELKKVINDMNLQMIKFQGATESKLDSQREKIEDLGKETANKIDTLSTLTETKITNLGTLTETQINSLSIQTKAEFASQNNSQNNLGVWARWIGGILLVATLATGGSVYYRVAHMDGQIVEIAKNATKVDGQLSGLSGQVGKVQEILGKLADSPKRADAPEIPRAISGIPSRLDTIESKIDIVNKNQIRLPFDRIVCDSVAFLGRDPSSLFLVTQTVFHSGPGRVPSQGLYAAKLADGEPVRDPANQVDPLPREIMELPVRIIAAVTGNKQATITMQFTNVEALERFRDALSARKFYYLDISGERLDRQTLEMR
jgi:hypothetical protein